MKVSRILNYSKGKAPKISDVEKDLIVYLTPEYLRGNDSPNLVKDFNPKVIVQDNDLILLWDGSNAGEFFKAKSGALSSTMVLLNFDEESYQKDFLYYQFKGIESYLKSQTSGSGIPHVDKNILGNIEFQEFKKSEQTQIAEILITTDKAIQQTEALIAKYQRIKTGLMQDLLTYGIDELGSIRAKSSHHFVVKHGMGVPEEWEVSTLEKLTRSVITYGIVQAGPHISSGIPYIRTGDMSEDFLSIENLLRTTQLIASKFQRSRVEKNDIVFALRATIGKVLIVPKELNGANLTQGTARIAPDRGIITTSFLLWSMRMPYFKSQILTVQKGTTFAEISLGDLRKMKIAYPIKLAEQERVTRLIEQQENTIQSYKSNLSKLHSLKAGLMQDLLSGKVRVNI